MIRVQTKLPRSFYLAVSGGVDSMAALHFFSKNHDVAVLFFNHDTDTSREAYKLVSRVCSEQGITMYVGSLQNEMERGESLEEYWRNERYRFFDEFSGDPVITCHHLDDCVETWIWSALHGDPKLIPLRNGNVLRPLRLNPKFELMEYARKNKLEWHEDQSNNNLRHMRNYIRHELLPRAYHVNPGLKKVLFKKLEQDVFTSDIDLSTGK